MSELLKSIDERTRLAGTNKLEILMFSLGTDARSGRRDIFGINVFKVREVMRTPEITGAPEMPAGVKGMVSLRGSLVPVVDLTERIGIAGETRRDIMIVTEYNGQTQGFLVEAVDTILRLDWSCMRVPPAMLGQQLGNLITAVTELPDGRLVMMLDVEKVLADACCTDTDMAYAGVEPLGVEGACVLYCDDSAVARSQIQRTLECMDVRAISATNGQEAWQALQKIAQTAAARHVAAGELVHVVLTDVEMPEMDGYILTKQIKGDHRFAGIPVVMHSSLSSTSNESLGRSVGVDEYVSKFEPQRLAETLARLIGERARVARAA